jgi:hypothetical protein
VLTLDGWRQKSRPGIAVIRPGDPWA